MDVVREGQQIGALDRTPLRIGRHDQRSAGHVPLRTGDEDIDGAIAVEAKWQLDRFARSCHRLGKRSCHNPDALADLFVVSPTPQPRNGEAFGLKGLRRYIQQTWVLRETEIALKQVVAG